MAHKLTLRKIGNSFGVILGREMVDQLGMREGEPLFAVRTPKGIELSPFDPDFVDAIEAGRGYMRRHRNAMRELAK